MSECKYGGFRDENRGVCLTAGKSPLVVQSDTGFETISCLCESERMGQIKWENGLFVAVSKDLETSPKDAVNSPSHYTQQPVECIEITQYLNFTLGNAVKYLWRYLDKQNLEQDLKKAIWYLNKQEETNAAMPKITTKQYNKIMRKLNKCRFNCLQRAAITNIVNYAYTGGLNEHLLEQAIQDANAPFQRGEQ